MIYQGNLQYPYQDGTFVLIAPEGLLHDQPFSAYWTISGVPSVYRGTFEDVSGVAGTPTQSLVHKGEKCEFTFNQSLVERVEARSHGDLSVMFTWQDERDIAASLHPIVQNIVNVKNDRNSSVYVGIISGYTEIHDHLIVLSVPQDITVGETTEILIFSPTGRQVKRDRLQLEEFERDEALIISFTARSARLILEAKSSDPRENGKLKLSLTSSESGAKSSATVEAVAASIPTGAITVNLVNDSGQTLQYWTARADPHVVEDLVNLGLSALSFVAPDWSISNALQTFSKGKKVYEKIKDKIEFLVGTKDTAMSSIGFLQSKTGKINTTDFLDPNETITFWDFDGTITGGMDMSLTWFRFEYDDAKKTAVLHFDTATTTFNKLESYREIVASSLLNVPTDFKKGEKLKRQGSKLRDKLPAGWTAKTKSIILATPLVRCNFQAQKISNLCLTIGDTSSGPDDQALPVWSHGMLYDPTTKKAYKDTFNIESDKVRTDDKIGYMDTNHLLYIEGDANEYQRADFDSQATKGTFIRHYFWRPPSEWSQEKRKKTAWSHKVVFLEYASIQRDPTGTYKGLQLAMFPCKIENPKIETGSPRDAPMSTHYEPFLDALRRGLCEGENWKKRWWAFSFSPDFKRVFGAAYPDGKDMHEGVPPWIIRRRNPPTTPKPDPRDWPVVAFVCQGSMPINFYDHGVVGDEINAMKYDS
ncbi:hypothetical protein F5Y12DRAFT_771349 [Xylaria sp. FL1777]|nr:hypothetical protein F5Y12DRAFT_771349 [Xylaria sp. FL1777]